MCTANSTTLDEITLSKFDKIDLLIIAILMLVPAIIFYNILKQGYISFFDLTIPASWMKIYPDNIEGYIAGLNLTNSIVSTNINSSFPIISFTLARLFGSYGIHIADIIPQILLGPFAYIFSRYFVSNRLAGIILSLFALFNPFVMMFNFDNITNIYSYVFIMPLIVSYFELRVKKNSKAAPFVALFLLLPPIYGVIPLLYAGTIIVLEVSYLFISLDNLKLYLSKLVFLPIILVTYLIVNIGIFLNESKILANLKPIIQNLNATFNVQPSNFSFMQIISFRAEWPYESGFTNFFPAHISGILEMMFLILFILVMSIFILRVPRIFLAKNKIASTFLIFIILFFTYSVGISSMGSDYLYINRLIYLVFPRINLIDLVDPWDNGIFMVIFYISVITSLLIPAEQKNKSRGLILQNRITKPLNFIFSKKVSRTYLTIVLIIVLIISSFYVITSVDLNNSYVTGKVPESDQTSYEFLENNSSGFFLTVPTTYAISFNYTKEYVDLFGTQSSPTDANFWWNSPPARLYKSGPFYQNIVNSLYYGNNATSRNEFDNLATLSGIEYIFNFNPATIRGFWGSPPPLSDAYILNHTDFKLIYLSNAVSIFKNPYFRGLSYSCSQFLVSTDPLNDTIRESRMNLSYPAVTPQQFRYLSEFTPISGFTFNITIESQIGHNISFISLSSVNGTVIGYNASGTQMPPSSLNYQEVYTFIFQNGTVGLVQSVHPGKDNPSIIVSVLANFPSSSNSEPHSQFIVDGMENIIVAFHTLTYLYEDRAIYLGNLIYITGLILVSLTCLIVYFPVRKLLLLSKFER